MVAGPSADFAARHWGREPRLSVASELPHGFTDLLDAAAVDELVSRRGLRTPFLRMAKDGAVLPAAGFTRSGGVGAYVTDQAADDKILDQLARGATLVLQALHRSWPPLVEFGSALSAELGHPVQVNAYITPPQNQGFEAHYDTHDVFVLQVSGRKRWRVHAPVIDAPLAEQAWDKRRPAVAERAAEAPLVDMVMSPGDALYLPRGYIHAATALGETSIHLTVGVHPLTRHTLVRHLLAGARDDDRLRASLPMGVTLDDPAVLAPHLAETVAALHAYLDQAAPADLARLLADDLGRETRPAPLSPLAQLDLAAALTAQTPLTLRPALRVRVDHPADSVRLHLPDRAITLPIAAESAMKAVLSGAILTPAELPGLDPDEQLVVARRLLREGVLVPA